MKKKKTVPIEGLGERFMIGEITLNQLRSFYGLEPINEPFANSLFTRKRAG